MADFTAHGSPVVRLNNGALALPDHVVVLFMASALPAVRQRWACCQQNAIEQRVCNAQWQHAPGKAPAGVRQSGAAPLLS